MKHRTGITRRGLMQGLAGAAALSMAGLGSRAQAASSERWDSIVVGAGVFGAWTAWHLRQQGRRVLLLDAYGPANMRASSGGESRMTRTIYGADDVYTRMALESLDDWRWLSTRAGLPVFHPVGVLMFFGRREPFAVQSIDAHRRMGLRLDVLERADLERRY
ncbi:MAG: FAD-dependent oxidoreductase, partial [Steroidobacteraceae bacterium]|nr:FAD-dependent oxidoreductase [Steroidobacteraceae bacterium]